MATVSDVQRDYLVHALSSISRGSKLYDLFAKAGIASLNSLVAVHASFGHGKIDARGLAALHSKLAAVGKVGAVEWTKSFPTSAASEADLRKIVQAAQALWQKETAAVAAIALPSAAPSTGPGAGGTAATGTSAASGDDKAALRTEAAALFTKAEEVHGLVFEATDRVKYELVGKAARGKREGAPLVMPLAEHALNLATATSKEETYVAFGQSWVSKDGHDKVIKIGSDADLYRQMARREQLEVVSGAFDVLDAAARRGVAPPSGANVMATSTVRYVVENPTTKVLTARQMVCDATPAGQRVQTERMMQFREQHPHVPIAKVVSIIDAGVQRRIANLKMRGATSDAAVDMACKKSPELYAVSLVEGAAAEGEEEAAQTTERTKGKKRARTGDEQQAADKRRMEQMQRQIENLKKNKSGKGNGGPPSGGGPPPGGPGSVKCPEDVCKEYNFKVSGCSRGQGCRFKHICALCGQKHCYRGNH